MASNYGWDTCRKAIKVFTFNIAVVVIGVVLYKSSTSVYSSAIIEQTKEWSQYPIKEIMEVPVNGVGGGCPSGYEVETYLF